MKITGNETAYPTMDINGERNLELHSQGLTIRQQFAMAAMQGLLSSPRQYTVLDWIVHNSVEIADALIAELNMTEE